MLFNRVSTSETAGTAFFVTIGALAAKTAATDPALALAEIRASAAEMLGLSRQSLYVKLRRFGMGDPGAESES